MAFDIQRVKKSTRKVAKFLKKNDKRPSSGAVHNLRTSSRSLEAAFITLSLDSKRKIKRLLREMGDVRKRAGKVRDMDVLTADALTIKRDGEQDCLVQLIEYLGAERAKHVKKLRGVIKNGNPQLRRNLQRNARRLEGVLQQAEGNQTHSDAIPETMARVIQLSWDLQSPSHLNRRNLHPYRLKVKELRNVLRLSDQADELLLVEKLGEVKDAIGEWHDWQELSSIAAQLLDHGVSCKLMTRLKRISDSKFERALSLTNRVRNQYFRARHGKHPARRLKTASTSVIKATSAFAAH